MAQSIDLELGATALLRRRGMVNISAVMVLSIVMTLSDLLLGGSDAGKLIAVGAVRLSVLACCLVVVRDAGHYRALVVANAIGASTLLLAGAAVGYLRSQYGILAVVNVSVCIVTAAFIPWGWRAQLAPIAAMAAGVVAVMMATSGSAFTPQMLVIMAGCAGASVYFAVDTERARSLAVARGVELMSAESKLQRLNAYLERRVEERVTSIRLAGLELRRCCTSLWSDMRPQLAQLQHTQQLLLEHPTLEDCDTLALVGRVQDATISMSAILDDLLGYVRLTQVEPKRATVDLGKIAMEIVSTLRRRDTGRRIRTRILPNAEVTGDPDLLAWLLGELLSNAWKFTSGSDDPMIEFGVASFGGKGGTYFVRDNGAGFDPAHTGKLFRPFRRLHAPDEFPGRGIGLARAHRIALLHGGSMWARATPGRGATFYFSLPEA